MTIWQIARKKVKHKRVAAIIENVPRNSCPKFHEKLILPAQLLLTGQQCVHPQASKIHNPNIRRADVPQSDYLMKIARISSPARALSSRTSTTVSHYFVISQRTIIHQHCANSPPKIGQKTTSLGRFSSL